MLLYILVREIARGTVPEPADGSANVIENVTNVICSNTPYRTPLDLEQRHQMPFYLLECTGVFWPANGLVAVKHSLRDARLHQFDIARYREPRQLVCQIVYLTMPVCVFDVRHRRNYRSIPPMHMYLISR